MAEQERAELRDRLAALDHDLKIQLLPKDAADASSAIVEIRAGTGGDEAALFAADLLGMYQRYCELQGWKTEMMSLTESDLGGIKDATLEVKGRGVYAKLKFESGVHRVQRVPATESQGRIHTSRRDGGGAAGSRGCRHRDQRQGSAHRHLSRPGRRRPACQQDRKRRAHHPSAHRHRGGEQTEKSQHKNKAKAMKLLKAKIYDAERKRVDAARASERKSLVGRATAASASAPTISRKAASPTTAST